MFSGEYNARICGISKLNAQIHSHQEIRKQKFVFFFLPNSQPIYNNTIQPVWMYNTTLTHVALKKSSGHKGRHHFKFNFFPYTSQNQKRNPFLHKISLLTEQDEFDIVLVVTLDFSS